MVRRQRLSFAGFAVDFGPEDARYEGGRDEQVIDAHAEILVEVAGSVIPPGVSVGFRMAQPVRVDETGADKSAKRLPFPFRYMRAAVAGLRIPYIDVLRRHVQITAHDDRNAGSHRLLQPLRE